MPTRSELRSNLSFSRLSIRDNRDKIGDIWLELQSRTNCSFFLSWAWVSIWLDTIQAESNVDFVVLRKNGDTYCCFFLGIRRDLHHWLFYKTRGYFNETGDEEIDDLTIEYNMVLGNMEKSDWRCLLLDQQFSDLEELCFRNITEQTYTQIDLGDNYQIKVSQEKPSYFVNLSDVRGSDRSYLELLKSNKRAQIKKSLAYFEDREPLSVREATSVTEALEFLEKLKVLHQMQWTARGAPGAFATDYFTRFHQRIVAERFGSGEIQLLEIGNSIRTIGYLYSFVYCNRVYYYQSGFCYETKNIARPGIICHYLAIEHNVAMGRDIYSFLAGDTQYKRSLSTHHDNLYTFVAVRDSLMWQLEKRLRLAKGKLAGWFSKD